MPASVPEPDFSALVELLSGQALVAMGTRLPGMQEAPPADLRAARFLVDLLAVLQAKTEGKLDPREASHLDGALYQLRMRVVELSRDSASQGA